MTEYSGDDNLFNAEHVRVFRETKGERGSVWRGAPILLLTTTGSVSGESRTTPLIMRPDGESWVIVASKGGAPDHPSWFKNIEAAGGDADIDLGPEQVPVHATVAQGDERARLWSRMTEVWPPYDSYQAKTDREIPVVVLQRR
jgi:deazaflavin-dependent oxidoreductase (nitroreductase family)